jgi:hypothetical protein
VDGIPRLWITRKVILFLEVILMNTTGSVRAPQRWSTPSIPWTKRWTALLAGALAAGVAGVCVASCNSSKPALSGGGGSCTNGGEPCAHGCVAGVGCGQCGADSDCTPDAPFCVLGGCVPCRTSTDCAVGQACSPADHECNTKCTVNANCTPNAPTCDTTSGACVGCEKSTDCPPAAPICESETSQCSQCSMNSDCSAADPVCDLGDGRCVQCLVDTDCPSGYLCGGNDQCHQGCKTNGDCGGARPICETATGVCVGCTTSTDCGAEAPICSTGGVCVQCVTGTDCKTPAAPLCSTAGVCVECNVDADCKAPLTLCRNGICERP